MNCDTCQALLETRLAEGLDKPTPAAVQAHLDNCSGCRRGWQLDLRVYRTLYDNPPPAVPAGFPQRTFAHVYAAERRRHWQIVTTWALTATLVLGIGIGIGLQRLVPGNTGYVVNHGEVILRGDADTTVQLAFNAGNAIRNVRFTVSLPQGVEIEGHPGEHRISWLGELKKGRNLLDLHVMAHAGAHGVLTADLRHGDSEKTFRVPLRSTQPESLWHRLRRTLT